MNRLANLDDDMSTCPSIMQYRLREGAEEAAKANGHNLAPYWTNYLGELHRGCTNCRHILVLRERNGVAGIAGRAATHRCGELVHNTHEVHYVYMSRSSGALNKVAKFENRDIAEAFGRTLAPGTFTIREVA